MIIQKSDFRGATCGGVSSGPHRARFFLEANKLTLDGDKLKGKGAAEFGGQKEEWDINGKREKKDK